MREELERRREAERQEEERALKDVLKLQMLELKEREDEARELKQQEDLLMRSQWETRALEERSKEAERRRKNMEFG